MKELLNLLSIAMLTMMLSGCYVKFTHENDQGQNDQDRQKDAGYQNFMPIVVIPPEETFLLQVSCTQQIHTLGTFIRNAINTHGRSQEKASSQLKCYQHTTTNEPLLHIKSKESGEWVWLARS